MDFHSSYASGLRCTAEYDFVGCGMGLVGARDFPQTACMATVHIIGAGISGLAAATLLAEKHVPVKLYEATSHAGGRCRSSHDAALGSVDHGLHLHHRGDRELQRYLARIGAGDSVAVRALPLQAAPLADYLPVLRWLLRPRGLAEASLARDSMLRDAWLRPVARLLFATPVAQLPARAVRQLLRRGRPCLMPMGLQEGYITPALDYLERCGGSVYFGHALTRIDREGEALKALVFARKKIVLTESDLVILATPPAFVASLLPGLEVPSQDQHAITLHYACEHREAVNSVAYPINAPMDMLRYGEGRISATIRLAGSAWHSDPELLARRLWADIQKRHGYLRGLAMPPYAIRREKRAGHAVSEAAPVPSDHGALLLAGDWLHPARAATLEAAAASGHHAAQRALERLPKRNVRGQ